MRVITETKKEEATQPAEKRKVAESKNGRKDKEAHYVPTWK